MLSRGVSCVFFLRYFCKVGAGGFMAQLLAELRGAAEAAEVPLQVLCSLSLQYEAGCVANHGTMSGILHNVFSLRISCMSCKSVEIQTYNHSVRTLKATSSIIEFP